MVEIQISEHYVPVHTFTHTFIHTFTSYDDDDDDLYILMHKQLTYTSVRHIGTVRPVI